MAKRAVHTVRGPNMSLLPYTMGDIWPIGKVVVRAGTQYLVTERGWRKQ